MYDGEKSQEQLAREELDRAKTLRAKDRERRKRACGILDRKLELSKTVQRRAREMCTCGAFESGVWRTAMHKEECPVVRAARQL